MALYGISCDDAFHVLKDCDLPLGVASPNRNNPKGFWRVDKDKAPELRHTVLTLVAFHDLEEKIRECDGDRDKGIKAFLNQNDGEGWMLPETLRLADYGLGHDDRAREHQPVAGRLGPRFYDWQLAQSPEESWRECHLHARNLLGQEGYFNLLGEVLRDTALGGWRDALKPACDLEKKESLVRVFSVALGFLSPEAWKNRLEQMMAIFQNRGFTCEPADTIQIIAGALKRVPKENRSEGVTAAGGILGETDFITALEHLLAAVPRRADHPWHQIIRKQIGEAAYRIIWAGLEMASPNRAAETQAPYSTEKGKMSQRDLFE
ncbi:MAG: hypothetical protein HGJ94_09490 [Desulfosarcina sp.]|nr:hypothetical protein [Desulfosarcina sp.]